MSKWEEVVANVSRELFALYGSRGPGKHDPAWLADARYIIEALAIPGGEATLRALVEETWKAVPAEPTEAMFAACHGVRESVLVDTNTASTWRAMLAAAPTAPEGDDNAG